MNDNIYNSGFADQFHAGRAQEWLIKRLISGINTAKIVKVLAVQPTAGKVGFVTVQPLVLGLTTNGTIIEESPIYQVPYARLQGGASAVILDPAVGDIGIALFAQDDISNLKVAAVEGPPASDRTYSEGDAIYIGGLLQADPTQFVRFHPGAAGIDIVSPNGTINLQTAGNVHFTAQTVIFDADVVFNGNVSSTKTGAGVNSFAAPIVAPDAVIGGVTQSTHVHGGVQPGGGNSSGPHN
jgi:hypothetical protein